MAREFPEARVFAPLPKVDEFRRAGLAVADVAADFPKQFERELECVPMLGTRVSESAFLHHPSRTLVLCNLAMNMEDVFTGVQGAFMRGSAQATLVVKRDQAGEARATGVDFGNALAALLPPCRSARCAQGRG